MKQKIIILCFIIASLNCYAQHKLTIIYSDKDSLFNTTSLKIQNNFTNQNTCLDYVSKLAALLSSKGFPAASIDELIKKQSETIIKIFLGKQFHWAYLAADSIDEVALKQSGYLDNFTGKPVNIKLVETIQQRLLAYFENNGYPFASTFLYNVILDNDSIKATIKLKTGPLYKVDSIRVFGKIKVNKKFLSHYFEIPNNSLYNKQKIDLIAKRIEQSDFMKSQAVPDVTLLGSGSVVNLYLEPKKTNIINFLLGFLPSDNSTGKMRITGEANLLLKNALSNGESIALNFQALQPKSPRLNLAYQQPFIFNSPFGINIAFDLFKKDTTFLNINGQAGVQFSKGTNQIGKLFLQWQNIVLLSNGVDTNYVKTTKTLPPNIDVSSTNLGMEYSWNNTNYRFNPTTGNEATFIATAGIRQIKKNNDILSLKDPLFNYASLYDTLKASSYQLRFKLIASHYFAMGKKSTLKATMASGIFTSPSIFRNELFQIGGNKIMRGFDEESIYATQYAVTTAEYRTITGLNSYIFTFIDVGFVKNRYQQINISNTFSSAGLGLLFDTKKGLLNISYALGKRNDVPFNLRTASKIHIGYVNYF